MKPEQKYYRKLDFKKITFTNKVKSIADGLHEIKPIPWSQDVLDGKIEIVISKKGDTYG